MQSDRALAANTDLAQHSRLSNENVSSVYDDRLDKIDPEGTLVPGQRRYLAPASQSIKVR